MKDEFQEKRRRSGKHQDDDQGRNSMPLSFDAFILFSFRVIIIIVINIIMQTIIEWHRPLVFSISHVFHFIVLLSLFMNTQITRL